MNKGKVTDYDLRSFFKDGQLNYLFIIEIDDEYEYDKYLTQVEYNLFMSKVLGGVGVKELREVVGKSVEYELSNDEVSKVLLGNNVEL